MRLPCKECHRLTANSLATLVTRLRVQRSTVAGHVVVWRENYRPAIFDFCNNIGQQLPFIGLVKSDSVLLRSPNWRRIVLRGKPALTGQGQAILSKEPLLRRAKARGGAAVPVVWPGFNFPTANSVADDFSLPQLTNAWGKASVGVIAVNLTGPNCGPNNAPTRRVKS
jgi:hypothetical protein